MTDLFLPSGENGRGAGPGPRAALFGAWLMLALYFVATHVMWRDEVRALTLALSGDTVVAMLRTIHGEGHPALWYLLLRGAHAIVPVREVLPATGAVIGIAAAALLAFRAPFRGAILFLALFGAWLLFEYTAVSRNYGISALLLFLFADRYAPRAGRGWLPAALLFLLCNTNVPAALLAAGLLLFWLVEVLTVEGWRRSPALGRWAVAAGGAALGVLVAFATVYPPYQDAAVSPLLGEIGVGTVLRAIGQVSASYSDLLPFLWTSRPLADIVLAVLIAAVPLSLVRTPGGLAAGVAVTLGLQLFFHFVYLGGYRHVALLLAFALALHWMAARGGGGRWPARIAAGAARIAPPAGALFALLLALQVSHAAILLAYQASGGVYGSAARLGRLLHRPDLRRAIVMADPDVMVEPLGYYAPNPTWLVRQKRFGRVVHFTAHADRELSLAQMLDTARRLRRRTGRPVVMLLQNPPDPRVPTRTTDGYGTVFTTTPREVRDFTAATTRLARFDQSQIDEHYDVYLLR